MNITVYGIPNCETVKKARAWFDERGIAYAFHDFKKQGAKPELLRAWVQALGWQALLNTKGTTWRKLSETERQAVHDEDTAIRLMLAQPSLIKRPVVQARDVLTVGYVPEEWKLT